MVRFVDQRAVMERALQLAARGRGRVEPNPPVGAVLVDQDLNLIGEGWHEAFGGAHAEVNAIAAAPGTDLRDATLFVTLEPCNHTGKTPPCTQAILEAGLRKIQVALLDPAPHPAGSGIAALRAAGLDVHVGLLGDEAAELVAPFAKLMTTGRPFVHAKWAMSLDGKIATRTGDSRWISSPQSRAAVHELRGRVDAVLVGVGTVFADDPLLTARPPGPRSAVRIILDSEARLPLDSQLVKTAREIPVIDVVAPRASLERCQALESLGVEVLQLDQPGSGQRDLPALLTLLGRRQITNLLVEGGRDVLGSFIDERLVDTVHVFVGPLILGGATAWTAVGGTGCETVGQGWRLRRTQVQQFGNDVYISGTPDWVAR